MAELNIAQPMRFRVDVKTGLVEQPLRESLMKGDKKANRIIAEIVNGGVPQDITGVTVKGKFCRPPDLDEIELSGTAEGNLAIVQLTDACYAQSGNYKATVSLVLDDVERTVLFISGAVLRSGSGNAAGEDTGGSSSTGSGLPSGGTAGQVLVKVTAASGDASWKTLTATDVKARPDTWMPTAEDVGALPSTTEIPTVPSVLPNPQPIVINGISYDGSEKKEITIQAENGDAVTETDPTVPSWAKNPTKPTYTADEVGALPATGTAVNSAKLGGKAPEYYIQPRNLLDNSDFRNPVNQRGQTSYIGDVYTIDRWSLWGDLGTESLAIENGHIALNTETSSVVALAQRFAKGYFDENKTYTLAYADTNGKIHTSNNPVTYLDEFDYVQIVASEWIGVVWAALYEGEYTADNLPPYVPKGYAAELAACQWYCRTIGAGGANGNMHAGYAQAATTTVLNACITIGDMRLLSPSYTLVGDFVLRKGTTDVAASITGMTIHNGVAYIQFSVTNVTVGDMYAVRFVSGGHIIISADL